MASSAVYKIERQSLADQVSEYIKRLILSGELQGGEKVPEERVAQQFGVSRTPIREALRRLEEYGLIYIKPRSYAIVRQLEPDEADQVACVRAQLEILSARLLAESGQQEDFDVLEELAQECDDLLLTDDLASVFEKDSQLHLEIARRTGNQHLYEIFEKLDAKVQLLRLVVHLPVNILREFVGQHHRIIAAMRRHDSSLAESLMNIHIMGQLDHYHSD